MYVINRNALGAVPVRLVRLSGTLLLLLHSSALNVAAQGPSLQTISFSPVTDTLYPGDEFAASIEIRINNPPQFGGIKVVVESEGAPFVSTVEPTFSAENVPANWGDDNIAGTSVGVGIPRVSCLHLCPGGNPETFSGTLQDIPTGLKVYAVAIERKFFADGTRTETEVARLLVKTYDVEPPRELTVTGVAGVAGQPIGSSSLMRLKVPGARFDEASGMNLFLIRSDDFNMLVPGRDFPCQGGTSFLGFNLCEFEILDAETLNVVVETFQSAQGPPPNLAGLYDVYIRWSFDTDIEGLRLRHMEAAAIGAWTIGEGPEGLDYSVRHVEINQAVQTDDNAMPMVRDKRTVVRVYPQVENLPEGVFFSAGVAVSLRGQAGQDGPSLGAFTRFPGGTAGPTTSLESLRKDFQVSASFILPRERTQVKDLFLTATVNLDNGGDPLAEESSTDNNTKSESFEFFPRETLAIGYLEACPDGCDNGVHSADRFLRKVFPAAETSGVAYIPLGVPGGLFGDPIPGFTLAGVLKGFKAVLFVQRDIVDMVAVWAGPIEDPTEEELAREILLRKPLKGVFGTFIVPEGPREKAEIELAVALAREFEVLTKDVLGPCLPAVGSIEFPTALGLDSQGGLAVKELFCNNRWISGASYINLFQTILTGPFVGTPLSVAALGQPFREKQQSGPGEFFLIGGTVRSGGSGSLDPAYRVPASKLLAPGTQSGDFCVELSGGGGTLERSCFDADFSGGSEQPFIVALPHHADGTRIALMQGGNELASLMASASPPSVAITSPSTGATLDASTPLTIAWAASDADGDVLTYTALYSPDSGESWLPLGVDIVASSVTFNAALIEGGENVLFRVLASDGFHTTEHTIGPVNVVQRPAIAVDAPADLGAAPAGQLSEGVVKVRSLGTGPLVIDSAGIDNPTFQVLSNLPMQVRAGTSRDFVVEFTPGMTGKETGTLTLTTNAPDQPSLDVMIEATGLDPEQPILFVGVESETLDFGDTPVGEPVALPIEIINRSQVEMSVELTIEGDAFRQDPDVAALTPAPVSQEALTLNPGQQVTPSIAFDPPSLGDFTGRLIISSNDPNRPRVEIALEGSGVEPPTTPAILPAGIVDAAQFHAVVAPGGIGSIFGAELADDMLKAEDLPLPFELGGARVRLDGWEAPLIFVSPKQINFQVPFEVTSPGQVNVVVTRNGEDSPIEPVLIAEFAPAVFINPNSGEPIIQRHPDEALITAADPAKPGDVLIIFVTGIGGVSNPPATGAATADSPLARARVTPVVTLGGEAAKVFFAGLTPRFAGLGQINIQLPESLATTGATMPLVIDFEGSRNPPVNLPVLFEP